MVNYLTIDVEDYFQVAAFEKIILPTNWEGYASRVERNINKILDLFSTHGVKGTFFIVGWTAERYPEMVKEIAARGHEIGCHSYWHQKIYNLTSGRTRKRLKRFLKKSRGDR
jgi:peptidoglycan/xylan/chitin deacetylase (PgdA/CDA1 family)